MKTFFNKKGFWLIIAVGLILIGYTWTGSFYQTAENFMDRKDYEDFLLRQISSLLNTETSDDKALVEADMPDMAALQDYFMTVDPGLKRVPKERLKTAYAYTKSFQESANYKSSEILEWQGTESDIGGRVRALMWDPNDPEGKKVWAGGVTGGLWCNHDITDSESPWLPVDDFWPNLAVSCITFDPNNPETFYVGTGEAQTALIIYRESSGLGFGIMKSEDAGETWSILESTEEFAYVTDLLVKDESGSSVLYAGVVSGTYKGAQHHSEPSDGLFRSMDEGMSWEQVLPDITGLETPYSPSDIELGASGRIFVGTMQNIEGQGGATILYSDEGTSGSWTKFEDYKILIENTPDLNLPGRVMLSAAPSDENIVYGFVCDVGGAPPFGRQMCFKLAEAREFSAFRYLLRFGKPGAKLYAVEFLHLFKIWGYDIPKEDVALIGVILSSDEQVEVCEGCIHSTKAMRIALTQNDLKEVEKNWIFFLKLGWVKK